MKDLLINSAMNNIEKYYDYSAEKLAEIRYGLASLYLMLTKIIVIIAISYLLGNLKTLLLLMAFYSFIRFTAFGVHAKKGWHCWISSLFIFIAIPYICEMIVIDYKIKIALGIICVILLGFFAPADTEKRPLINKKKRIAYKLTSVVSGLVYIALLFFVKNNIVSNCILFGLIIATFVVLPITYKLFGVSYNNYQTYKKN